MKSSLFFIAVLIAVLGNATKTHAQDSKPGETDTTSPPKISANDELQSLIILLDGNKFQDREKATQELIKLGNVAIERLAQRALNASPESARRIKICLEGIGTQGGETTFFKSAALLALLYGGGNEQTEAQIDRLQKEWNVQRTRQAIASLRKLGAKITEPPRQGAGNQEFFLVESFDFQRESTPAAKKKNRAARPKLTKKEIKEQIAQIIDGSLVENRKRVLSQQNLATESASQSPENLIIERMERQLEILGNGRNIIRANHNNQKPTGVVAEVGPDWNGSKSDFLGFAKIENLTSLVLQKRNVDKPVLESIKTFRSLNQLTFVNCRISGPGLSITGLPPSVSTVRFVKQKIDVSTIDRIGKTNTIFHLAFDKCTFSKSAFRRIFQLEPLASLEFRGTQLDSDAFDRMAQMKTLSLVRLQNCRFSIKDYYGFRRTRPDTTLELVASAFLGVRSDVVGRVNETTVGCLISEVVSNSAAERAGIHVGDRIAFIAGNPISKFEDLRVYVSQYASGDQIEIRVEREKKMVDLKVKLGNFDDAPAF